VTDLTSTNAFFGGEVPVLPGIACGMHRRALHQIWVVGHEVRTFWHHTGLKGAVPDWKFRGALTGLACWMVGLEDRADSHTCSKCEVVVLPRRANTVSWHALVQIGIPFGSLSAVGNDTGFVLWVPQRMSGVAGAAVVIFVVCMVDWAHDFTSLKGEVEHFPGMAWQNSRSAFFEVGIPLR